MFLLVFFFCGRDGMRGLGGMWQVERGGGISDEEERTCEPGKGITK